MNTFSFLLTIFFLINSLPLASAIHYISIGRDCQTPLMLNSVNLRKASYPLDWLVSKEFDGVLEVFKEDFKYFLDENFLEYHPGFIRNTHYEFLYNHFFPLIGHSLKETMHVAGTIVPNYLDYLPAVQATQNRRIERLLNLLTSDQKIVFIRTHSIPSEAESFVNLIKEKYPQLDFILAVLHDEPELKNEWNLANVCSIYSPRSPLRANWWDSATWHNIFLQLQRYVNKTWPPLQE